MSGAQLLSYLGWAFAYALISGAVLLALARSVALVAGGRQAVGWGGRLHRATGLRVVPALVLTLFFVFLTQHPFPDPAAIDCSAGGAPVKLVPFGFVRSYLRLWAQGAGLSVWLRSPVVSATAMNFLICAAIGMALRLQLRRFAPVLLFAMLLSGTVELTQLTGIWGLYPCAYRQFDVNDLILNISGVAAGFALARSLWRP